MGIDITIVGTAPRGPVQAIAAKVKDFLDRAAADAGMNAPDGPFEAEDGALAIQFDAHPAASPIQFYLTQRGRIIINARTSQPGPGYHQWICELADRLGKKLAITWLPQPSEEQVAAAIDDGPDGAVTFDETGYWTTRDRAALEHAVNSWLTTLGAGMASDLPDDAHDLLLTMPLTPRYQHELPVLTPMGPRTLQWLRGMAKDPASARTMLAWWDHGLTAQTMLNRALVHMWSDVGWDVPGSQTQETLERGVLNLLEQAFALDPTLDYPWREWAELNAIYDVQGDSAVVVDARAGGDFGPLVGYRRNDVTHAVAGGWTIRLPGSFTPSPEDADEDGVDWCVANGSGRICVRTFSANDPESPQAVTIPDSIFDSDDPPAGRRIERDFHDGRAIGALEEQTDEDGNAFWILFAEFLVPGAGAHLIAMIDPDNLDFAEELLGRMHPPRRDQSTE